MKVNTGNLRLGYLFSFASDLKRSGPQTSNNLFASNLKRSAPSTSNRARARARRARFSCMVSILVLQCAIFVPFLLAQDTTWVKVEGLSSMENVTKEEARSLAIKDAMRKAVEQVVGVDILAETIAINFRLSGDIVKAMPYGRVLEREIIEEGVDEVREEGKTTPSLIYRVKIKANVVEEKGNRDPYFKIKTTLNRDVFREGDDMEIKVTPTRDCYITIFNLLEDEKVLILIPNRYKKENFIKANETFNFPDEGDMRRGIRFIAHTEEGRKAVIETFYILGLKQPLRFDTSKFTMGIFGIYNGKTAFIKDLMKEIIKLPPSERAERFIQYKIMK